MKTIYPHCEKINNYPEKNLIFLLLWWDQVISKLDINRLRQNAKILIEIGDDGIDLTFEDYYLRFNQWLL